MTLGVAMIARNGAKTMVEALAPFLGKVDEVSIVLGGPSEDETERLARKYADVVGEYDGLLSDEGLFDFGHARQQAFDQLTTDYALVVDADDIWEGIKHLDFLMGEAVNREAPAVMVRHNLPNSVLYQPRIYKKNAGRWRYPVHELFDYEGQPIMTGDLVVSQNPAKDKYGRGRQNIIIGEYALSQTPDDTRVIAHLARDYRIAGDNQKALDLCCHYLELSVTGKRNKSEYAMVLETKSEVEMLTGRHKDSLMTAVQMLTEENTGTGWATLAEAAYKLAGKSEGLLRLAILASDEALRSGRARTGHAHKVQMSGAIPCLIKAMSLCELGRYREALRATDLGLMLQPENKYLQSVQLKAAQEINEVM